MANRRNVRLLSSVLFAAFTVFRVPGDGDVSLWGRGVVVDENGAPLPGVTLVRHDYVKVPFQGRSCGHVAIDLSSTDGRFTLAPWYDFWAADQHLFIAYRKGYVLEGVADKGFRVTMRRHQGTALERLKYLDSLVLGSVCFFDPSPEVARLLDAIVMEEEQIATDEEERSKYVDFAKDRLQLERERISNLKGHPR